VDRTRGDVPYSGGIVRNVHGYCSEGERSGEIKKDLRPSTFRTDSGTLRYKQLARRALPRPDGPSFSSPASIGYREPALCAFASPSSRIALRALNRTSTGTFCMLCAVLACAVACLRMLSSELPRISKSHPGLRSLHLRTFVTEFLVKRVRAVLNAKPESSRQSTDIVFPQPVQNSN
jgi:hypothetical protein